MFVLLERESLQGGSEDREWLGKCDTVSKGWTFCSAVAHLPQDALLDLCRKATTDTEGNLEAVVEWQGIVRWSVVMQPIRRKLGQS